MARVHFPAAASAAVVFFLLISRCSPADRAARAGRDAPGGAAAGGVHEYGFDVDDRLLGPRTAYTEVGLSLAAPADWQPLEAVARDALEELITETATAGLEGARLLDLFLSESQTSALSIFALDGAAVPSDVAAAIAAQTPGSDRAHFRHAGLEFSQVRSVLDPLVSFALITQVEGRAPGLLQYVVAPADGEQVMRSVESSIGSIRPE